MRGVRSGGNNYLGVIIFSEMLQGSIFCVVKEPDFNFVLPDLVASSINSHEISYEMYSF